MPIGFYPDRVKEAIATADTASPWDLDGAATGYRAFSAACTSGNNYDCCIQMDDGSGWVVGEFTYTSGSPGTLTLVTTYSSGGSMASGAKSAFIVFPSDDAERISNMSFALATRRYPQGVI